MSKPLNILILEDHPFDAEIMVSELEKAGFTLEWQRVDNEAAYLAHLTPTLDVILSDYMMSQFEAPRALELLQEKNLDIPFIVVTGTLREEIAVACLKQGAVDYLIKDRLARLGEAVKQALHQKALREEKQQILIVLRESEERFRTLTTSAPIGIFQTDSQGKFVYVNQRWGEIAGLSLKEALNEGWQQGLHPEDQTLVSKKWSEATTAGQVFVRDYRFQRADGRTTWVFGHAVPLRNEAGEIMGYIGTIEDITSRKEAEEMTLKLYHAQRERYQEAEALRQAALALVSTVDLEQVFERILENLQNVVPFDSASVQLLEESHLKIIGGRGFPNLSKIVGTTFLIGADTPNVIVLKTQKPLIIDDVSEKYPHIFQGVHALAKIRSWLGTPLQIGDRLIGMLTLDNQRPNFYTKNHARKAQAYAAQATIAIENARLYQETEKRIEQLAVLHELDQAISTSHQLEGIYQVFAKYTARLLPYDYMSVTLKKNDEFLVAYLTGNGQPADGPEQPLPMGVIEWVITHGQPLMRSDIRADPIFADDTLQARGIKSILSVPLRIKGQMIGVWSLGNCQVSVYNSDYMAIAQGLADQLALAIENTRLTEKAHQEIEERKKAQAALELERTSLTQRVLERTADLEQANLDLTQAFHSKDEFLTNMSHELRTPLNAILGMVEILQEEVYGTLNQRQGKSINTIKKSGEYLLALINDILDFSKIEAGQVKLDIGLVDVNSICQTSLQFIKQIAHRKRIKISTEYDVSVSTVQADERRLKQILVHLLSNAVKFTPADGSINLQVKGDSIQNIVHFMVQDTGSGIPKEQLGELFEPFGQLDGYISRENIGSGLGLSLVYRLIELHGGSVTVDSNINQGSQFTVSLPWQETETTLFPPLKNREAVKPIFANNHSAGLILLAEDSQATIDTLYDYLTHTGYELVLARDGREAVDQTRQIRPNLILMDIQMPYMDGLEAIQTIRADHSFDTTPIIALTALAMKGDKARCLAAGANGYLSKPVSLKKLVDLIAKYIQHGR